MRSGRPACCAAKATSDSWLCRSEQLAEQWWTSLRGGALQMEEEKHASKEAFDATAFAQLLFGPGGRQTGTVFLAFGIPRDNRDGTENLMNPGNEAQHPASTTQTADARTIASQSHRRC